LKLFQAASFEWCYAGLSGGKVVSGTLVKYFMSQHEPPYLSGSAFEAQKVTYPGTLAFDD